MVRDVTAWERPLCTQRQPRDRGLGVLEQPARRDQLHGTSGYANRRRRSAARHSGATHATGCSSTKGLAQKRWLRTATWRESCRTRSMTTARSVLAQRDVEAVVSTTELVRRRLARHLLGTNDVHPVLSGLATRSAQLRRPRARPDLDYRHSSLARSVVAPAPPGGHSAATTTFWSTRRQRRYLTSISMRRRPCLAESRLSRPADASAQTTTRSPWRKTLLQAARSRSQRCR